MVKGSNIKLCDKEREELLKMGLFATNRINKLLIYSLTHSINDTLHFDFLIKNLYHRMIFTACALVAKRYGATLVKGMSFTLFTTSIRETLENSLSEDLIKNKKLQILLDVFSEIKLNTQCKQEAINQFIEDVSNISDNINSDFWNGEDVMAIFFNEFNRYDVNVLAPRFPLTPSIAIFIATVIKNESVKYAFNNKWTKELMEKSEIILPAKSDGTPDFDFMEQFIQSLPYSRFF